MTKRIKKITLSGYRSIPKNVAIPDIIFHINDSNVLIQANTVNNPIISAICPCLSAWAMYWLILPTQAISKNCIMAPPALPALNVSAASPASAIPDDCTKVIQPKVKPVFIVSFNSFLNLPFPFGLLANNNNRGKSFSIFHPPPI